MEKELTTFVQQLSLMEIEKEMFKYESVDIPVEHTFSGGIYMRQISIPKGILIMGKRHRYETCNILLSGELCIYMGKDTPINRIKGPLLFTSKSNVKKFFYCYEDAVFATIHPTKETDLEKLEKEIIIPEEEYKLLSQGGVL